MTLLYRYPVFVRDYLAVMLPAGDVPVWVVNAAHALGMVQKSRAFNSLMM